jgi:hypothetical protein
MQIAYVRPIQNPWLLVHYICVSVRKLLLIILCVFFFFCGVLDFCDSYDLCSHSSTGFPQLCLIFDHGSLDLFPSDEASLMTIVLSTDL